MSGLQHPRPATSVDATFLQLTGLGAGPSGELWSSGSLISGAAYTSVFAAALTADYALPVSALGYTGSVAVIEANSTSSVSVLGANGVITTKACGKYDFQLYSVAPVLSNGKAECVLVCQCVRGRVLRFCVRRLGCDWRGGEVDPSERCSFLGYFVRQLVGVSDTARSARRNDCGERACCECVCACARVRCVFVSGLVLQHQVPVGDECVMHVW